MEGGRTPPAIDRPSLFLGLLHRSHRFWIAPDDSDQKTSHPPRAPPLAGSPRRAAQARTPRFQGGGGRGEHPLPPASPLPERRFHSEQGGAECGGGTGAGGGGEAPGCPARLVLSFGGSPPGLADEGARADKDSGGGAADADADVNVRGVWLSWEEAGPAG